MSDLEVLSCLVWRFDTALLTRRCDNNFCRVHTKFDCPALRMEQTLSDGLRYCAFVEQTRGKISQSSTLKNSLEFSNYAMLVHQITNTFLNDKKEVQWTEFEFIKLARNFVIHYPKIRCLNKSMQDLDDGYLIVLEYSFARQKLL